MIVMIDISNTTSLQKILSNLTADKTALWGKMSAQGVVEHLIFAIEVSTDKNPQTLHNTEELAAQAKARVIYTDMPMSQNVKNPLLGDEPPPLVYPDMQTAKDKLMDAVNYFFEYYNANPSATHIQPRMGAMNFNEWLVLHNKHFTHHFKQFGLI